MVTSTANMSTGVTTQHPRTVKAWTPGQHPTTLDCCKTQRKQPFSSLAVGKSISVLCVPFKILERLIYARVETIIDPLLPQEQAFDK